MAGRHWKAEEERHIWNSTEGKGKLDSSRKSQGESKDDKWFYRYSEYSGRVPALKTSSVHRPGTAL